jgi:hypothetical protein
MERQPCKICFKNVIRLTQHVRQTHDMDMATYRKRFENKCFSEDDEEDEDETESHISNESENSDVTETESENDTSEEESDMEEYLSESEEQPTFFEHMLDNMDCESLTEKELISLLVKNTQWYIELEKHSKNDSMLEKIEKNVKKYVKTGLNYNEAISTVFEKETTYFTKLVKRNLSDEDKSAMDEDLSESEEHPTFFEHMLNNMDYGSLTEKELISQLVRNTQRFLALEKYAKNDTMLKKIKAKVKKYTKCGLKYNEALTTVFEKETAYFCKLLMRNLEDDV